MRHLNLPNFRGEILAALLATTVFGLASCDGDSRGRIQDAVMAPPERDVRGTRMLGQTLRESQPADVLQVLSALYESPDALRRKRASRALFIYCQIEPPREARLPLAALARRIVPDTDDQCASHAVAVLTRAGAPSDVPLLARRLATADDPELIENLGQALGHLQGWTVLSSELTLPDSDATDTDRTSRWYRRSLYLLRGLETTLDYQQPPQDISTKLGALISGPSSVARLAILCLLEMKASPEIVSNGGSSSSTARIKAARQAAKIILGADSPQSREELLAALRTAVAAYSESKETWNNVVVLSGWCAFVAGHRQDGEMLVAIWASFASLKPLDKAALLADVGVDYLNAPVVFMRFLAKGIPADELDYLFANSNQLRELLASFPGMLMLKADVPEDVDQMRRRLEAMFKRYSGSSVP